jgi:hypothetical protein
MVEPPDEDPDRTAAVHSLYDQYYEHVRHIENEMWAFARIWAIIITGVFTIIGTDLPTAAKLGAAFFGALLSVFGFLTVYALRIPFLDYYLTTDLIARDEFGMEARYRRFPDDPDARLDKLFEVHELLVAVYVLVTGLMVMSAGVLLDRPRAGVVGGTVAVGLLVWFYLASIAPRFDTKVEELSDDDDE